MNSNWKKSGGFPRKLIVMVLCTIFVLLLSFPAYAENAGDYVVDMDALTSVEGGAVLDAEDSLLFGNKTVLFVETGVAWKIGSLDLSKYSSVEIGYGCDQNVRFDIGEDTYIALTQNGATQNNDFSEKSDVQIISRSEQLPVPYGSWSADPQTITFDINSDYNGDVYLAYNMENIENRMDGIAVFYVRFVSASSEAPTQTTEERPDPTPASTAPSTAKPTGTGVATTTPEIDGEKSNAFPWLTVVLVFIVILLLVIAAILLFRKKKSQK